MTTCLLIRHGQTEWNRVECFRGRLDIPLNALGRAQAQALATRLSSLPIASLYSSPLGRARETAEAIGNALACQVEVVPGLIDINYGHWQGLTPSQVAQKYPGLYAQWLKAPHQVHFPEGESLDDLRKRATLSLQALTARHPQDTVLLVGHQVVNRIILCIVLGLPNSCFWHIVQDNACLNCFHWEEGQGYSLSLLNDTSHLGGLSSPG